MSEENMNNGCCCGDGHEGGCYGHEHGHDEGCCCGHEHDHDGGCCCGQNHDDAAADEFDYEKHDVQLPTPTLIMIATTLAQQAMVSMGILPNPMTGKSVFLMNQARYLIDSIDVLFDKTEGNRTEDETRTMSNMMSELRMLYVKSMEEKNRREAAKKS